MWAWPLPPPSFSPSCPVGKTPISPHLHQLFFPSLSSCKPLCYQWSEDRLSEMFLLIPISLKITSFHVSGWPRLTGEGSGNYPGVPGINPTRCHWMACLPQWLMNGLLVSHYPHPLLFLLCSTERATESVCWAVTGLGHIRPLRPAIPPRPFSPYFANSSVSGAKLIRTEFCEWQSRQHVPWNNICVQQIGAVVINCSFCTSKCIFLKKY